MNEELKKLKEILVENGPAYNRVKMELGKWEEKYKQRNNAGDINVIKFFEYFLE